MPEILPIKENVTSYADFCCNLITCLLINEENIQPVRDMITSEVRSISLEVTHKKMYYFEDENIYKELNGLEFFSFMKGFISRCFNLLLNSEGVGFEGVICESLHRLLIWIDHF